MLTVANGGSPHNVSLSGTGFLALARASWPGVCRLALRSGRALKGRRHARLKGIGYDSTEKWEQGMTDAIEKNKSEGEAASAARSPGQ